MLCLTGDGHRAAGDPVGQRRVLRGVVARRQRPRDAGAAERARARRRARAARAIHARQAARFLHGGRQHCSHRPR